MKLLRIKANYTENKREYFIFTILTDDKYTLITDTEMFGYVVDEEEDGRFAKYPFIITATISKDYLILNYGADSEYATSKINLPKKKLEVGEYFTRWEEGEQEEYTYVIDNITEIIS